VVVLFIARLLHTVLVPSACAVTEYCLLPIYYRRYCPHADLDCIAPPILDIVAIHVDALEATLTNPGLTGITTAEFLKALKKEKPMFWTQADKSSA
jgi:hypothetical protein